MKKMQPEKEWIPRHFHLKRRCVKEAVWQPDRGRAAEEARIALGRWLRMNGIR